MTQSLEPFVWGEGGAQLTPEQVARRREIAQALVAQGMDYSPIGHWTQGLARVAQGALGGYQERKADEAEAGARSAAESKYADIARALMGAEARAAQLVADPASPTAQPSAPAVPAVQVASLGGAAPAPAGGIAPDFQGRYDAMLAAAPEDIRAGISINSGYRSPERQGQLWADAVRKYGSEQAARKWVAPPGKSNHNKGEAMDLAYANPAVRKWVHENAGAHGLAFPLAHEPWHIERADLRGGAPSDPAANRLKVAQALAPHLQGQAPEQPSPAVARVAAAYAPHLRQQMMEAAGDPWLSPGRRAVVQALLQQQMAAQQKRAEPPRFGLNPIYGTDDAGNSVVMQPGTNGQMVRSQMPPGVTISQKPIQIDAGTHTVLIDPITRQPITQVPKNVAGAAQERALGTAAGEAQAALPGAEGMATQIGQHIDALANDPYLPSMVGPLASHLPNVSPEAARVQSRMDQLSGGAFLQARGLLKGGGAITDFESQKAEAAFARLNAAQSIEDYRAALTEFKDATTAGLAKLRQQGAMVPGGGQPPAAQGGGNAPGSRQPGSLAPGAVVNGFIYRGGNPKDQNSWERAQ